MSGNVKNTNVERIKNQVDQFVNDLEYHKKDPKSMPDQETFEKRYSYLHRTSKTLFNYIFKEYNQPEFDKKHFDRNLGEMLKYITKIQKSEITQDKASEVIGTLVAKQYIPQLKDT